MVFIELFSNLRLRKISPFRTKLLSDKLKGVTVKTTAKPFALKALLAPDFLNVYLCLQVRFEIK